MIALRLTLLATFNHILNPTQDKDNCPKSDQGAMIPPEVVNKKRGTKPLLRRKEAGKEEMGFTNGKVNKKGLKITCSICGTQGYNKRCHGFKAPNPLPTVIYKSF